MTNERWRVGRSSTRTQCGEGTCVAHPRGACRTEASISGAADTCVSDGADSGSRAWPIGVGADGPQHAMTFAAWQTCIGAGQCAVRSVDAQTEPEHATITMSIVLKTCVARALMDMTRPSRADGVPAGVCAGIAGNPSKRQVGRTHGDRAQGNPARARRISRCAAISPGAKSARSCRLPPGCRCRACRHGPRRSVARWGDRDRCRGAWW